MPERFEVSSVEEAIDLAQRFKDEGRYDWFRGQVLERPPFSSLHRAYASEDAERGEMARRRLVMFCAWARKVPELRYLLEPDAVHDLYAILQHYGIPTHYIDFTTDPSVAGFFAAHSETPPPSQSQSVIYCLNTDELREFWETMKEVGGRKEAAIELVTIDVRNLWRLQAQRGTFVYANYNWDVDYPMDSIVFPYKGPPAYPTPDRVYPRDKSHLEQLLDQYLSIEQSYFGHQYMLEQLRAAKERGANVRFSTVSAAPCGYREEAFGEEVVPALASWAEDVLAPWLREPTENFFAVTGRTIDLSLRPSKDAKELSTSISTAVRQVLRAEPDVRNKAVEWRIAGLPPDMPPQSLDEFLRPAWNGMRRLPYSDSEIADAFGGIAALLFMDFGHSVTTELDRALFSSHFGDALYIEFQNDDESSSRSFAARQSLHAAVRSDIVQLVLPKYQERLHDLKMLLQAVYTPSLLFEFEPFKAVFAREIIPGQLLLRRSAVLFNPASLRIFGLP